MGECVPDMDEIKSALRRIETNTADTQRLRVNVIHQRYRGWWRTLIAGCFIYSFAAGRPFAGTVEDDSTFTVHLLDRPLFTFHDRTKRDKKLP